VNSSQVLSQGTCLPGAAKCSNPFLSCNAPSPFVPPPCPDNCTNNGICVNVSECANLTKTNCPKSYKDKSGNCPTCTSNLNTSKQQNYTTVCACYDGQGGINCAVVTGISAALVAGLATGVIVAIILAALAAAACAGGGGFAISNAVSADKDGSIFTNPLYQDAGASRANPLHGTEI